MAGATKKDKNWIAALLHSILVGSLGILKLITLGGFGIWWLIDLILVATKHDFAKVNWVES